MSLNIGKKVAVTTLSLAFALAGGLFYIKDAAAATNSIYLTPSAASVKVGDTVTVSLRITPASGVSSVTATVNFDTTKLQYLNIDASASPFTIPLAQTQSGGTVHVERGQLSSAVTADSLIETISFKALAGSGSSSLSITGANAYDATTAAAVNPGTSGATISFTTPVTPTPTPTPTPEVTPKCATGQTGTYPNCVTPKTSSGASVNTSSGAATTNTSVDQPAYKPAGSTPATVTDKAIGYTSAAITSTSKDPTQVYIRYGLGDQLNLQTTVSDFATSHVLSLDPTVLIPGQTYSYVVVATNKDGLVSQSAPAKITTKGLKVVVAVVDNNRKPVRNKTVVLHSTPVRVTTDDKGIATFTNVSPGTHHVIYAAGKKSYDQPVTVVNDVQTVAGVQSAETQNFSVVYNFEQGGSMATLWIWMCVVILIIGALVVLAQTGRLGIAFKLRSNTGAPLVSHPVVVGKPASAPHTPTPGLKTPAVVTPVLATKQHVEEQLNAIPEPPAPQPGSTISPQTDKHEGKVE